MPSLPVHTVSKRLTIKLPWLDVILLPRIHCTNTKSFAHWKISRFYKDAATIQEHFMDRLAHFSHAH